MTIEMQLLHRSKLGQNIWGHPEPASGDEGRCWRMERDRSMTVTFMIDSNSQMAIVAIGPSGTASSARYLRVYAYKCMTIH